MVSAARPQYVGTVDVDLETLALALQAGLVGADRDHRRAAAEIAARLILTLGTLDGQDPAERADLAPARAILSGVAGGGAIGGLVAQFNLGGEIAGLADLASHRALDKLGRGGRAVALARAFLASITKRIGHV